MDIAVCQYEVAASFGTANTLGEKLLIPLAGELSQKQMERIIKAASENPQVKQSYEMLRVLGALRNNRQIPIEEFDQLLQENNLKSVATKLAQLNE